MKLFMWVWVMCLVLLCGVWDVQGKEAKPFAVVELFTSQGCSSCPPADRLLSRLAQRAEARKLRIFPLSFHVDYWNHLGWRDPFGSRRFTKRQRRYTRLLRGRYVYTPQMIINGKFAFVGSHKHTMARGLKWALRQRASVWLRANISAHKGKRVSVAVRWGGKKGTYLLQIAVVERKRKVRVRRGENSGKTLSHTNVVRRLYTNRLGSKGRHIYKLKLPFRWERSEHALVLFVQEVGTLRIVGATKTP